MFRSYITIAWRNLRRNKGYSLITIGSLALGMATAIMIGLWIYDELSFNRYHENYDTIAKVYRNERGTELIHTRIPQVSGLGTLLRSEYSSYFKHVAMVRARLEDRLIGNGPAMFTQSGYFMQEDGPEMFSLKMIAGTRDGLHDPQSILLSRTLAEKLFPHSNAVDQVVKMDASHDLKVTGVFEDLPKNSEFASSTWFAPLDVYLFGWSTVNDWDNNNMYIYVQMQSGKDFAEVSSLIKDVTKPHIKEEAREAEQQIFLQPMSKWHLYSEFRNGVPVSSNTLRFVWLCGMIGAFVLLLACINFMNLSTARSERRAREVGIKKSIGSLRSQLIQQFFSESIMVSLIAFAIALLLVQGSLSWFNAVGAKAMTIPWSSGYFWLSCLTFIALTGLLAGSYPAFYLSSFSPVKVLKGAFNPGRFSSLPRKALVVVQFVVSVALAISTLVIYQQIDFVRSRPIGYSPEGMISLRPLSPEYKGKYETLRAEMKNTGGVEEIAAANYPVTSTLGWDGGFEWKGQKINDAFNTIYVTHEYGKTVGLEFVEGRDFSREIQSDLTGSILLNESAAALTGIDHPLGEILDWRSQGEERSSYRIIGIVKDMVKGSPFGNTFPSIIFLSDKDQEFLYIRLDPNVSIGEAIPKIKAVFNALIPSAPFDFNFSEDEYKAKFKSEESVGKLAGVFSFLAILISCSGLFGLASFVAERRTKEIGIRKVLGASVVNLWQMLSKDFLLLMLVACIVAIPLTYHFLGNWLLQYDYHTTISGWVFVAVPVASIVLTLLTVSFQTIRAALANPVRSLRSE